MWKAQSPMLRPNPAEQWERFGRDDPYYGVYSIDEFRGRELDAGTRDRFFASGEEHVEAVLADVRKLIDPEFQPSVVLDYGCGVGRVLIPLARLADRAVGVDVSPSMLGEARANLAEAGLAEVELVEPPELHRFAPEFDFVHTAIVLQHVPVRDGERIVSLLAGLLRPGGIGAIHLPIGARRRLRVFNALMRLPLAPSILNAARGRPWSYPHMQMNVYDLSRLMTVLRDRRVQAVHLMLASRSGGYDTCTLFFRR